MFTTYDFLQIIIFLGLLIGLTPILGNFMYMVFTGEKHLMSAPLGWLEMLTYKLVGVDATEETNWKTYAFGMLTFNLI
jgi:K+-transporting ATPase ATPase A chain